MKCPVCPDVTLLMSERQGVEIDYCPQCRGIWLDRGELDKLLAVAAQSGATPMAAAPPQYAHPGHRPDFADSDHHGGARQAYPRKKSWLSEIFD